MGCWDAGVIEVISQSSGSDEREMHGEGPLFHPTLLTLTGLVRSPVSREDSWMGSVL